MFQKNNSASQPDSTLERGVFMATLFTTFVVEQLLWDGQFITYPMFKRVHNLDEKVFVSVHRDYVRSLGIPTYVPCFLYLFSTFMFLFVRPVRIPRQYPLVMNLLNLIAVISTFIQLVPIHIRIDRDNRASDQQVEKLISYNRIRFGLVAINSGILLTLLSRMLRTRNRAVARIVA